MNHSLRTAAYALLSAFVVLVAAVTWTQAIRGPEYRDNPQNPRYVASLTGRERGPIVTADGTLVAVSEPSPTDQQLFERTYPEGELYAHTVGYTSVLYGSTGVEDARSADLLSDRDATISGVLNGLLGGDTRPRGIGLTIDHALQAAAYEALDGQKGSVVAIDPETGEILAMVSLPSFDPNGLVGGDAAPAGQALEEDPDEPLRNRAIDESYPPGSSFKVVTTASGLDSGVASPSSEFEDPIELTLPGSTATIRNADGEVCDDGRTVMLSLAFIRSCNTVFGQLGMDVGGAELASTAEAFGFNQLVPFDLPLLVSRFPDGLELGTDPAATAQNAIGQRDVQATPLLMAMVAAAVANGGTVMQPHLVSEVFTSDGQIESVVEPSVWGRAMSPATASVIGELMEQAVLSGTGRRAAVPGVRIAGKTGTAEVTGAAPHAWFIGYGPVEPEDGERSIAVAVVVESGGDFGESATGGLVAAPIAADVFATFFGVATEE